MSQQLQLVLTSIVYTTHYNTVYAVVSRFWIKLPDGTRVLKREETRYITPEEYAVIVEEEAKRGRGRVQAPVEEGEVATAVGALV